MIFHVVNARLFSIGIFPWAMIALTTIFLDPSWPRDLARGLRGENEAGSRLRNLTLAGALLGAGFAWWFGGETVVVQILIGGLGGAAFAWALVSRSARPDSDPDEVVAAPTGTWRGSSTQRVGTALLVVWLATQVLVPLRHWVIPGDVAWTEDGHRFAWRMKLRQKGATATLFVVDPIDGRRREVDYDDYDLDRAQINAMESRPDMLVQLAHEVERRAGHDVEVYAESTARLNGRPNLTFVRPDVDLTAVAWPFWRAWFVTDLDR